MTMNLLFWGMTLSVIGKVIVVLAVLHMHHSLVREHRVDKKVIFSYHQERILTFVGLIFIVIGYCLEIFFFQPTEIFTCNDTGCSATVLQSEFGQ